MQLNKQYSLILLLMLVAAGCKKTAIELIDNQQSGDPNITFLDNYTVTIGTYRIDSFLTSGHETFMLGQHNDSLLGKISAGSYAQVLLPDDNPVKDKTVFYDSLELLIKPTGNFYGDTLKPFAIQVYRLDEKISNEEENDGLFFNPRSFRIQPSVLGSNRVYIRPTKNAEINIRLSDVLGKEILNKFRTNHTDIQTSENFLNYFKGIYLTTDAAVNSIYFFKAFDKNILIRLHYRLNATTTQQKTIDFAFNSNRQFNQILHQPLNGPLTVFTNFKKQFKESGLTARKAFLDNNIGTLIKIAFPNIFSVKELYPYVKILKAELVLKPQAFGYQYPNVLPKELFLYTTNDNNDLISILKDASGQNDQNGSLVYDRLFPDKTQYRFDVTQYINTLLKEGRFTKSALMLTAKTLYSDTDTQRLVLNDQTLDASVQLKLYVLGL